MKKLLFAISLLLFYSFVVLGQANQSTKQDASSTKKSTTRIRWSAPLCKEINQQGSEEKPIEDKSWECDQFFADGQSIRIIKNKNIYLAAILAYYEGYYVADLFITNSSDEEKRFDVLPEKAVFVYWEKPNTNPKILAPILPEKIAAKIKKRAQWVSFLRSFSAAFATTTVQTNTTTMGSVSVLGNNGSSATGTYSGTSTSTTTAPNRDVQRQTEAGNQRILNQAEAKGDIFLNASLRATTLFRSDKLRGALFFDKKKMQSGIFAIEIDGVNYEFAAAPPKD
jgi:hypothetical protein